MQPFPNQDVNRNILVIQDTCDLLHDDSEATQTKVKRWIRHVLNTASEYKRWWFLENIATSTVDSGSDVIDLVGHIDKVSEVFCPRKLRNISLNELVSLRTRAIDQKISNAGRPKAYALEAGRRIHLWPAPATTYRLNIIYTRPMDLEILPDKWETIILNGVLGMFGQHFDRDALTQNPSEFERRFYQALRNQTADNAIHISKTYHEDFYPSETLNDQLSLIDDSISLIMPASVTGIGYVSIQLGDYPQSIPI